MDMKSIFKYFNKVNICRAAAAVCFIAMLAALVPVFAAPPQTETVRVGYYENEVFEEGAAEGAVKTGYAYEYYRKLSEYTGWKYEYVYGDYSELYNKVLSGEVDLIAGLAYKEDRKGLIGYPQAAMGNESYSLVKHITDTAITSEPSTLAGKRIGVLNSALLGALNTFLLQHNVSAQVMAYDDYATLFSAFDSNEVDVLAAEGDGAYGRENSEVLYAFGSSDYYLCVSINRPDLLRELDLAQAKLNADEPDYIRLLRAKYYSASVSSRAFSETEKEWLSKNNSLHIGYLNNYLPYSETDKDGNVTGIIKDIVPKMFGELSVDLKVTYTGYDSYDAMIAAMSSGDIDTAFPVGGGLYYSEENGLYQTNPVVSAITDLVTKGDHHENTYSSFAVNENNRMQYYYVKTLFPEAEIIFVPSIEDCLEAVIAGAAECTTLNGLRANDMMKNSRYKELSLMQLSRNDDRCFGVEIGNEGLLKLLNRGISITSEDYIQRLAFKYSEGLYTYTFTDMLMDNIGLIAAVVLAVIAIVIFFLVRDSNRSKQEMRDKERARLELESANSELAESQKALSAALSAAENANRAKTVFLSNMSHDIRTPMNAIVGFTELAAESADDKEQVEEYLEKISVSSKHLLALINDVLDISRIESGKVTINESSVHLPDVIRDLETIIRSSAEAKQQELTVETRDIDHEYIITDKLRLNQILLNLLTNAVKFTPSKGSIHFLVSESPTGEDGMTGVEFRVRDNGIGMSEEFRKTIFEAFTREQSSTVSGIQGTGLGMAITKNIVDMMGGRIEVVSAEHKGSEFTVYLPCRISSAPEEQTGNTVDEYDFAGRTLLLAEDNDINQQIAAAILTRAGFTVDIANDGTEAVRMIDEAEAGRYDVVLMDIQMPVMNGYEAARCIRAMSDPQKANIPIIAVTANAFDEDKDMAFEAGMNGHLAKPYDIPKIMETLARILK